jgi:serine protease AprX
LSHAHVAPRATRAFLGAVLATGALATLPAAGSPLLQAVVSYQGQLTSVPGVHVVASFDNLRMAVVRGDAVALTRLAHAAGVRGLAPDDAVQVTSKDEDKAKKLDAVLASEGLGGSAGKAGAGAGVRVAVIDTGVSDTAALNRASGRLVDGADASQITDGQYGQALEGGTYTDGFGHGTFLANIIAGGTVPGVEKPIGVAPGATVVVVRVARPDGTSSLSKVLGAMDWVIGHRDSIDVANLSLSHERPNEAYGADPLTDAVQQVREAGVSIVVSSGNEAGTVGDPGFTPQALTVGAADLDTKSVASFSGSDSVKGVQKPDVVANGVHVMGILPPGSVLASSGSTAHLSNGLYRGSGTSQAAAVTSGVAALFLAAHPGASPAQVKGSIRCAAKDIKKTSADGAGLLNATTKVCADDQGQALNGSGDTTGEAGFDASSWGASSWGASSWGASSWGASSWGASSWGASSWGASSWGASSWGASSWGASSWSASDWGDS